MQGKVEIIKEDGTRLTLDLISEFETHSTKDGLKKYILMTANELDQNGLIKILASQIEGKNVVKIESEEDWTIVKNIMRAIISSSKGDFNYINIDGNLSFNAPDDYSRAIAVQDVAKQVLIKDYEDKKPEATKLEGDKQENKTEGNKVVEDEVVPGISEIVEEINNSNSEDAKKEETPESIIPQDINMITFDETLDDNKNKNEIKSMLDTSEFNKKAREELMKDIEDAVDKYLKNITNESVDNIKDSIVKLQEELDSINTNLKIQE